MAKKKSGATTSVEAKEINSNKVNEHNSKGENTKVWWQWWLPYLGGVVAFLALVGSLITFSISQIIQIYQRVTWKEEVTVISFMSAGEKVFLNSGDGEVFLSHVDIKSAVYNQGVSVNSIIKPKEFLYKVPGDDIGKSDVVSGVSDREWAEILTKPRTDESFFYAFFFIDDPTLQIFKKSLGERLRTFPASAQLIYYSANGGKKYSKDVPVVGIIMHIRKTPETNGK
ncbi:MAG TPA: hypothetical protein VGX92_08085 [Pyrinomonadaceae bacterium]|jgi:hypothetical protein|nr:hypothetical protein [Pyrinomonadaceae bacterium]